MKRSWTVKCLALLAGTLMLDQAVAAGPVSIGERVKRATVLVIREVPGSNTGGQGTGFFINRNGLVITNNHVVDAMHGKSVQERLQMTSHGMTKANYYILVYPGTDQEHRVDAELLHHVESTDLAILQLKAEDGEFPKTPYFISLIPDGMLVEGLKAQVTGFPAAGARGTGVVITRGEVTELMRTTSGAISYVETDAEVHPGNSGGPVTSRAGQLIGIATHKRFRQGEKDRSGAVPAHLLKQFLKAAFEKEVISKQADIFPFADIFLDQNGILRLPTFERESDEETVVIHHPDGTVRKAKLLTDSLTVETELGTYEVPFSQAAYLFVDGDSATVIMDGGDQLTFAAAEAELRFELAGKEKATSLRGISVLAFPYRTQVVPLLSGTGAVVSADQNVLSVADIDGEVVIDDAHYAVSDIETIRAYKNDQRSVETRSGERLRGKMGGKPVKAVTTWSAAPLELNLAAAERVDLRIVEWAYYNASGRRLVERLDIKDDEIREIAEVLDSPDWERAGPLLEEVRKGFMRKHGAYQAQVKLLQAVNTLRLGDYADAAKQFRGVARDDDVGLLAGGYLAVMERFPDHQYMGAPLSTPDAMWRASRDVARQMLVEIDARMEEFPEINENRKTRELRELERDLDIADRLSIGIAQSKLIEMLNQGLAAKWDQYTALRQEYSDLVDEYHSGARRGAQARIRAQLGKLDSRMDVVVKEAQRLHERLVNDTVGFVMAPPQLEPRGP